MPLWSLVVALLAIPLGNQALHGRIVDSVGQPVSGAAVLILRGGQVQSTIVSGDGTFGPVSLPPGDYQVQVTAPGFQTFQQTVTIGEQGQDIELKVTLLLQVAGEVVVVTGAQVDELLARMPDRVTVIDRQDIRVLQLDTVGDALRAVPGLGVLTSGTGPGGLTNLFPRGGPSDYALILIDGIAQNRFGGGFDAAHLDTAGIERIEVVRGPQSALYGSGATNAIVQVVTRHGGPSRVDASAEGGSFGTWRVAGSGAGTRGRWIWGTAADRLVTSNADGQWVERWQARVTNDDYSRLNASGSVGWSDQPGHMVRADVRLGQHERGEPGPFGSNPLGLYRGLDDSSRDFARSSMVGLTANWSDTGEYRHHFQLNQTTDLSERRDGDALRARERTRRISAAYQLDLDRSILDWSAGTSWRYERADSTDLTATGATPAPVARFFSEWFLEGRRRLGDRIALTGGVQIEIIERGPLPADADPAVARPPANRTFTWPIMPKFSASWFVGPFSSRGWTKLRLDAGLSAKAPTALEIAITDNPTLQPERSGSVDAGIEHAMYAGRLLFEADGFRTRYTDMIFAIATVPVGGVPTYHVDNIAQVRASGAEVSTIWIGGHGLRARVAFTWLDTDVLALTRPAAIPPYAVGDPLVRRPPRQAYAELTWSSARASAFVTTGGRSRMTDVDPNSGSAIFDNPGYVTLAVGGSLSIGRQFELFAHARNLLNRSYEEVLGYPMLGRSIQVGIRVVRGH